VFQVNFTLPPTLKRQQLLYSGIIRLKPVVVLSPVQPSSDNGSTSSNSIRRDIKNQTGTDSSSNSTSGFNGGSAGMNTTHNSSSNHSDNSNSSSTNSMNTDFTAADAVAPLQDHSASRNSVAPSSNTGTASGTAATSAKRRQQLGQQQQDQDQVVHLDAASTAPAVGIPYQGYTQYWSRLRVPAVVNFTINPWLAETLQSKQNSLCYAPFSKPVFVNSIMDSQAEVPGVCSGGFSNMNRAAPLNVSLSVLKASPECSLRVTLVPEVPARM
jgi:hypothetical protein